MFRRHAAKVAHNSTRMAMKATVENGESLWFRQRIAPRLQGARNRSGTTIKTPPMSPPHQRSQKLLTLLWGTTPLAKSVAVPTVAPTRQVNGPTNRRSRPSSSGPSNLSGKPARLRSQYPPRTACRVEPVAIRVALSKTVASG
mgnify:CR=1 FL=1